MVESMQFMMRAVSLVLLGGALELFALVIFAEVQEMRTRRGAHR